MGQLITSVSGVRGIVGTALTPDRAARFAAAFGTLVGGGKVVVGRDSRPSGEMISEAARAGLRAAGCDVVWLGIVPTPTIQLMVESLGAQGGVALTASHNPLEWNALKFISHHGTFLEKADAEQLFEIEREGRINWVAHAAIGRETEYHGAVESHVDRILALPILDVECIGRRRLKVVVDALHGAGGPIASTLLNALGCRVDVLYGEPTGRFPREPEPVPENLDDLRRAVVDRKADIGFGLDPDGDRLAVVDETGRAVGEDTTLPLAMRYALRARTGPVVVNYSTSLLVDAVAERFACPVYRAPVGEANVVAKMREVEAVIGGEGNGGVILPDLHLGRDAPVGMALIVALLSEEDRPLSALVDEMPRYVMRKQKIEGDAGLLADALDGIAARFRGAQVDRTDGLYLRWPDGFLHVRRSGTEPIVRIIAEAESPERLNERMNGVRGLLAAGH